ncbi:cobalamin biosynthesis protein CbiX [Thiocapsa imhoffii]|uniref:Cobalamin biosynthesis protein CbiX n=1 Tax=Thiocapsa imhoffii TaxID=382777 RepID=A0A9X0WG95_9GAMM|nr:CbiX/SirB N-terminal domain-containing protein [Thiocapsa imhoffii]MBK1644097.1 cobalamin biosynthesis protein CbiX [Thiocapsa imhoffii]
MRDLLLIDNGSKRADAILSLRAIAERLGARVGRTVLPVSLLHAHHVPSSILNDQAADTFEPFMRRRLTMGVRHFSIIPLFFGPSRAISDYVPERLAALRDEFGSFEVRLARNLCPMPAGEPLLAEILFDLIHDTATRERIKLSRVLLVDHGSPIPAVTEVRNWLARRLRALLDTEIELGEAVMERRAGSEYDFNGALLEDHLRKLAAVDPSSPVILSMLFLSPGRHAGPGGDIAEICATVSADCPGFRTVYTPLVGSHPKLIEILARRAAELEITSTR